MPGVLVGISWIEDSVPVGPAMALTLVPFQSLLRRIADDVGIVHSPGKTFDLELAPEAVANLKARLR